MKMKTTVQIPNVEVEVDEVAVIGNMIHAMTRGASTVYSGKLKNGKPVLFIEQDNEYNEHDVRQIAISADKKTFDKFFHLMALYHILTGRDYCTVAPAECSFSAARNQRYGGDLII